MDAAGISIYKAKSLWFKILYISHFNLTLPRQFFLCGYIEHKLQRNVNVMKIQAHTLKKIQTHTHPCIHFQGSHTLHKANSSTWWCVTSQHWTYPQSFIHCASILALDGKILLWDVYVTICLPAKYHEQKPKVILTICVQIIYTKKKNTNSGYFQEWPLLL